MFTRGFLKGNFWKLIKIAFGFEEEWRFVLLYSSTEGFPGGSVVKNPPANAGDAEDVGSIPGKGRSPREGMATHSSILAWKIPWTEELGGLQSMGSQRVQHD